MAGKLKLPTMVLAAFLLSGGTYEALAEGHCGEREKSLRHFETRYGETVAGRGITFAGYLMEIVVSEETGSWTLLVTQPGGPACMAATGENWMWVDEVLNPTRLGF